MEQKTIAVVGATDLQGKGVVNALTKEGSFKIRAISRKPGMYNGNAHKVVQGQNSDDRIQLAKEIATGKFTSLNEWIKQNVL